MKGIGHYVIGLRRGAEIGHAVRFGIGTSWTFFDPNRGLFRSTNEDDFIDSVRDKLLQDYKALLQTIEVYKVVVVRSVRLTVR